MLSGKKKWTDKVNGRLNRKTKEGTGNSRQELGGR